MTPSKQQNTTGRIFNNKGSSSNFGKQGPNQIKGCSLCCQRDHTAANNCPNIISDSGRRIQMMPSQDICTACPHKLNLPPSVCLFRVNGSIYKSRWLDGGKSRSTSLTQSDSTTDSLSIKSERINNQEDIGAGLMQLVGMGNASATSYMANFSQSLGVSSPPSDVEKKIFSTFFLNNFCVVGFINNGSDLTIMHNRLFKKLFPHIKVLHKSNFATVTCFDNMILV